MCSRARPANKELKLTKPSIMELRSLTPVLGHLRDRTTYAKAGRRQVAADAAAWVGHAVGRPVDVVIANTGRSSAGPFILAVGPKEPPVTRVAVGGLLAGERRTVGVLAPPCGSGDDVVVIVDADAVVSERLRSGRR